MLFTLDRAPHFHSKRFSPNIDFVRKLEHSPQVADVYVDSITEQIDSNNRPNSRIAIACVTV